MLKLEISNFSIELLFYFRNVIKQNNVELVQIILHILGVFLKKANF